MVKCRDYGRPGCLGEPDPKYVMDFSDIGEGPIHWCSKCGPSAHALDKIVRSLSHDPAFVKELDAVLTEAEAFALRNKV